MGEQEPITQMEIARRLGLSQKTVSQAFCGTGRLSQQTRQKILDFAREAGYRPNFSAQSIRRGQQNRIGLFMGMVGHRSALPVQRLRGMQMAALEAGVSLNICTLPDTDGDTAEDMGRRLGRFGVDAMLINYVPDLPQDMDALLARFRMPVITVNNRLPQNCVCSDDEAIAFSTFQALFRNPDVSPAYVEYGIRPAPELPLGMFPAHYSEIERRQGAQRAAQETRHTLTIFTQESFPTLGPQWLRGQKRRPVIVCYNEVTAMRVYMLLAQGGVRVPQEALVAYYARQMFHDPVVDAALRAILLPEYEIGYRAVQRLMQRQKDGLPLPPEAIGIDPAQLAWINENREHSDAAQH